jgi:hypothetical protein
MPKLTKILYAVEAGKDHYHADVVIDFSDMGGEEEQVWYGVNGIDPAPICKEIWSAIQAGTVEIRKPEVKTNPAAGAPDVAE